MTAVGGDKVLFAVVCMASATDPEPKTKMALATMSNVLMSDMIAKLLEDESGEERIILLDKMKTLWAIHEEHAEEDGPVWEH